MNWSSGDLNTFQRLEVFSHSCGTEITFPEHPNRNVKAKIPPWNVADGSVLPFWSRCPLGLLQSKGFSVYLRVTAATSLLSGLISASSPGNVF